MLETRKTRFHLALVVGDVAAILGSLTLARSPSDWGQGANHTWQVLCVLLVWLLAAATAGTYQASRAVGAVQELLSVVRVWIVTLGGAVLLLLAVRAPLEFDVLWALVGGATLLAALRCVRRWMAACVRRDLPRDVLLIGNGEHSRMIARWLENPVHASRIRGWLSFHGQESSCAEAGPYLGTVDELRSLIARGVAKSVILSPPSGVSSEAVQQVVDLCDEAGIPFQYVPGIALPRNLHAQTGRSAGIPVVTFLPQPTCSLRLAAKRAMDLVTAAAGLLVLSPLMLAVALAIKLQDGGPVFYRQRRVGRGNQHFDCLKFRSMTVDADVRRVALMARNEQDGPAFKIRSDPRVTALGRFLRRYSIDELPQLLNVLVGDMSIVGPRPPTPEEVYRYEWWQRRRVSIRPGITCIWQVWGRNRTSFKRWVEMDLQYIDNWSLWMDVKLMLRTVAVVFRGTGV